MNPEPTDLNDLAAIARTTKSARYRRALATAISEIENLRARVRELEGIIDWHIDEVCGDAWVCHIEGDHDAIQNLLTSAVGKEITAFHVDTSHHESTDP
jgi:hypothetical protein